jgi:hypothetical protein
MWHRILQSRGRGALCCVLSVWLCGACRQGSTQEGPAGTDRGISVHDARLGVSVDDVRFSPDKESLYIHYRTKTSARDCEAQKVELVKLWRVLVRDRLASSPVPEVVLFPEDSTGLSVSMGFRRDPAGLWSMAAPCVVTIPADVSG